MSRSFLILWAACLMLVACDAADQGLPPRYRELRVPEERLATAEARARGRDLYAANCALCHGEKGDGRGVRRQALSGPPADFTRPAWRRGMTPRRLFYVIREGKPGTSMASWKALGEEQTWDLVAYVLSLSEPVGS